MTDPKLLDEYEQRFQTDPDPWDFETSPYEQAKRRATLDACGEQRRLATLELGAANGVLAAELAMNSASLVAIEATPTAAALARERLEPLLGSVVVEGLIPGDVPPGPYDLIVASEILYYLDEPSYQRTLEQLDEWLAPGGRLVAVHWRPTSPERPRSAETVHADLRARSFLNPLEEHATDDYLLDVLVHE